VSQPVRPLAAAAADLFGGEAFELAVVPLSKIVDDLGIRVAGERGGVARPCARAGEDAREWVGGKERTRRTGGGPAGIGQRDVGSAGMTARLAPFGGAVAHEPQLRKHGAY
jgi:hypothetical protein